MDYHARRPLVVTMSFSSPFHVRVERTVFRDAGDFFPFVLEYPLGDGKVEIFGECRCMFLHHHCMDVLTVISINDEMRVML